MTEQWYEFVTSDEVLDRIANDDDSLGYACDWLAGRHGLDLGGSFTKSSICEAVENDDPELLEEC